MIKNLFLLALIGVLFHTNRSFSQTKNVPLGNNGYSWGYATPYILGGQQIPISKAPYQVSTRINGVQSCGGTIISKKWILTAAHCVVSNVSTPSNITIQAGSTDKLDSTIGQIIDVHNVYIHPNYNNNTLENDIALLYLSSPLSFNNDVMPIEYANMCNTDTSDLSVGTTALLTGWGMTCNSCEGSQYLRGVSMPLISQANAMAINIAYDSTYNNNISSNMLPFYNVGTGAGPGDSGGPAVIDKNGNKIDIGASSWGFWPKDQLPTIYSNIRNYSSWIESKTGFSISDTGLDLYIKDKPWDMGFEPSNVNNLWESEDIWVRKQNDGLFNQLHEDPEYYSVPTNHDYIYVRIRNRGCLASTGSEKVKLYWAKAATSLSWPNNWNGTLNTSSGQPIGGYIGEVTLPIIQPGNAAIVSLPWNPPNPDNYVGAFTSDTSLFWAEEPHHFCLLARIETSTDPMSFTETSNLVENVNNNNNIVWKNMSVVDLDPNNIVSPGGGVHTGATVIVGDAWGNGGLYDIEFANPPYFTGNSIIQEAEVKITIDENLWNKWQQGGFKGSNIKVLDESKHQLIVTGNNAKLENLTFLPNERNLLHVGFNFLTKEVSDKNEFEFSVIQRNASDNSIIGGEEYVILKSQRTPFSADAGNDKVIELLNNTTLSAYQIGEQAVYNWYDENGNLIYTGKDFSVSPEVTTKYKLEVIASIDGFKDYDEVEVKVKEFYINSISPNPSDDHIIVNYKAANSNSAYLMIVPLFSSSSNQYVLNTIETTKTIDVSSYQAGQYAVVLICNGIIVDFKNILIQ